MLIHDMRGKDSDKQIILVTVNNYQEDLRILREIKPIIITKYALNCVKELALNYCVEGAETIDKQNFVSIKAKTAQKIRNKLDRISGGIINVEIEDDLSKKSPKRQHVEKIPKELEKELL